MTDTDVRKRLTRLESRVCRGSEALGVDCTRQHEKSIDLRPEDGVIIVDSLAVTVSELLSAARPYRNVTDFDVMYDNKCVCVLLTSGEPV